MAALPASAEAPRPLPPPPAAGDEPDRLEGKSEDRSSGSSNAESLDRLLPPVGAGRSPRKRTTSQCKSEPPLLRTSKRTIYTAGRPPWYNEHGTQSKEAFAIGLGGGSASGKTTVARMIIEALDVPWVVLLSMDSFYKLVLTRQQQEQAAHNNFNFDHPDAFDFDLIISTLKKLKQGKSVKVPIYDFTTHSRKKDWKTLYGANVIIFEGIMAFADKTLLELLDMKIFVDTDSDIRLVRRLRRDISERGRDIEGVIKQYNKFVKPAFDQYIQPTMRVADIVVPRGSGNTVAIDLIVQHVHSQLEERELSVSGRRSWEAPDRASSSSCIGNASRPGRRPPASCPRMSLRLPLTRPGAPAGLATSCPLEALFPRNKSFQKKRPGVVFSLSSFPLLCKPWGLLPCSLPDLLFASSRGGQRKLRWDLAALASAHQCHPLPRTLSVLKSTPQVRGMHTIISALAAQDHDVPEDKIFLLSLLMAEMGVHSVAYAFPRVRIITTAVDKRVNDLFRIIPGIGNFGDRYFGTDAVPDGSDEEEGGSAG
ncbi:uridine-cytidine kinase-like 1 [Neophocaena asiaeorientalis asiaeorientalis]|uniref:Uridine-cytidine kinase n=1 Tax=Neophocaena asiaeorientalis asiaeorientalis TaxID=1706337 RepID=A0A341BVI5_NEOAA|nr:uridine-cytidine kinase-like 1 [Neophocaena asiaeorientalis asiaeorientalis]